ncbi:hypothetical protein CYMTET_47569 [Cymbomonas tetramitiformis]|uniref:AD domain-containing protein n=1 Tax=Cymbomonas tetramitiformis TaxID=36881 RepID=A0AAE0EW12_9CHLO|nr:hypothetical protein CYMTET_47569 [Cymbomonas tetramitiformis]
MSAWDGGPPKSMAAEVAFHFTDQQVGYKAHFRSTFGETIKGEIFAVDKTTNCVIIHIHGTQLECADLFLLISHPYEKGENGLSTIRVLKMNFVKEVLELERPTSEPFVLAPLPPVDEVRCLQRETAAVKAAEEDAKKIGVGVSEVAQHIFDGLAKTLPCKWEGKSIIVMDEVVITEPYTPEHAKGPNQQVLQRVQKVLEGERQRVERGGATI